MRCVRQVITRGRMMHRVLEAYDIYEKLKASLDAYEAMQSAHLALLSTVGANHPDMSTCNFERARAFENLKIPLMAIIKQLNNDPGMSMLARECRNRLSHIQQQDRNLMKKIKVHKSRLNQKRRKMMKGKKMLIQYGNPCSNPSPKLLNQSG